VIRRRSNLLAVQEFRECLKKTSLELFALISSDNGRCAKTCYPAVDEYCSNCLRGHVGEWYGFRPFGKVIMLNNISILLLSEEGRRDSDGLGNTGLALESFWVYFWYAVGFCYAGTEDRYIPNEWCLYWFPAKRIFVWFFVWWFCRWGVPFQARRRRFVSSEFLGRTIVLLLLSSRSKMVLNLIMWILLILKLIRLSKVLEAFHLSPVPDSFSVVIIDLWIALMHDNVSRTTLFCPMICIIFVMN